MSNVFVVEDSVQGGRKVCKSRERAKEWRRTFRRKNHEDLCVEKKVPLSDCLCEKSEGEKECAAHHYARTVVPHKLKQCPHYRDVGIDEEELAE